MRNFYYKSKHLYNTFDTYNTMNTKNVNYGTIKVSDDTKEKLKTFGTMGETYEDVIKRLIFMSDSSNIVKAEKEANKKLGGRFR